MAKDNDETNNSETTPNVTSSIDSSTSSREGTHEPPKREENPFSFKHFLKRDPSLNSNNNTNLNAGSSSNSISTDTNNINSPTNNSGPSSTYQNSTSTGARPKVPQCSDSSTKMKRSPRFPSFDSQASLAEYTDDNLSMNNLYHSRSNTSFTTDYSSANSNFVQRSYSNYDMDSPPRKGVLHSMSSSNCSNSRPINAPNAGHRLGNSEFQATLPDFVQDHLVMEEFYNAFNSPPASTSPLDVDPSNSLENLEFEINSRMRPDDMPFDLMSGRSRTPMRRNSPTIPLDHVPLDLPSGAHIPLDLTINGSDLRGFSFPISDGNPSNDIHPTLPDFLSDGPIHSSGRLADVAQDLPSHLNSPDDNSPNSLISRLRLENERLRRELDDERTRRSNLERTLEIERVNENQYSATLAHSMEQVEQNLDRSNKRAVTAQTLANKLKVQVKQLSAEVESLRLENESLKEEGAVGGSGGVRTYLRPSQAQQISRDLLLAASSAENNLRQLLSGVENLRVMAASLENTERIVDQTDFLTECDDDLGPAL